MKYILFSFLLASATSLFFPVLQDMELKGIITDEGSGQPVAHATISVKNSTITTTANNKGEFTLKVPVGTKSIIINAIGYQQVEINIKKLTWFEVKLKPSSLQHEEVVVSGYGVARDEEVASALSGRAPGVDVRHRRQQHQKFTPPVVTNFNTEDYDAITENTFLEAISNPLSTFSIDVDGASYSNVRRYISQSMLPPAGSVRVEELINYFRYDYPQPQKNRPFSINTELSACPWNNQHKLVMIGLQGRKIETHNLPASNLVFLIDVSGSMMAENKLPLVKSSLKLLVEQLREKDKVAIVVYAGNAGIVLPSTNGHNKQAIIDAIEALEAGGSTAGGAGIRLAYNVARNNFVKEGNNRVILCTDGDFNIGVSSDAELERIIEEERKSGVFLTVLGYGMGNYKDNKMQKLADKGNGNHSYIDNLNEAKKVLVNEFGGTLFTIAKDVKLQVEFNPALVQGYRLIGYENRMLKKEDFNNDKKDAGDIGSGHTVTALYEIIPAGVETTFLQKTDRLKYQQTVKNSYRGNEMMNIKIRYKEPDGEQSRLLEHAITGVDRRSPSENFRFICAVAQYGMLLSNSEFKQQSSFSSALSLAKSVSTNDDGGYRKEFINLIQKARLMYKEDIGRK